MITIIGLGNPEEEYDGSRHNIGRRILEETAKKLKFSDWKEEGKKQAHTSEGKIGKTKIQLVLPDTAMNLSGTVATNFIKSAKQAKDLLLIHDELDVALGDLKMTYGKSSGGHRGVESVIKKIKTKDFMRIRVGLSKKNAKGQVKKVTGGDKIVKFVLGKFTNNEEKEVKKMVKKVIMTIEALATDGITRAMIVANTNK